MKTDQLSPRQLYIIYIVAIVSPLVRGLPQWTVAVAGKGAWLTGIFSFLPMLMVVWLWSRLVGDGVGLAERFQMTLGKGLGKVLATLYMVWVIFLMSLETRLYGQRLLVAGYEGMPLQGYVLIILGLVIWMSRGTLATLGRMAEMFYLVLAVTLVAVLGFSLWNLNPSYVLPIWIGEISNGVKATTVPTGIMLMGVVLPFLWGSVKQHEGNKKQVIGWLAVVCCLATVIQLAVIGQLGTSVTLGIETPFFQLTRGLAISGAFQRMESIVVALWLLSDFVLLVLLVQVGKVLAVSVVGQSAERWVPWAMTLLVLWVALGPLSDGQETAKIAQRWIPLSNFIFGALVPFIICMIQKWKEWLEMHRI